MKKCPMYKGVQNVHMCSIRQVSLYEHPQQASIENSSSGLVNVIIEKKDHTLLSLVGKYYLFQKVNICLRLESEYSVVSLEK